jgi:hypothetical protein
MKVVYLLTGQWVGEVFREAQTDCVQVTVVVYMTITLDKILKILCTKK